ncbi:hypothetical protein EGR_00216 [Echinococcus granulosus]|uniref:Protein quiver n=1 Tax=Echinococcus granulosus TaxID=6210 RepID=W6V1Y8_ECHGR|nr:hypothetical protein EGR_00216 [Echinococcus granulosus]EUB64947.1 hypothetical protein EGR_00216 [Echinococcus granulosus]
MQPNAISSSDATHKLCGVIVPELREMMRLHGLEAMLKGCEDPFPKRDMFSPHLPTVDCYEDCFKWLYIDYQQKHQLIRGCSSQLILKIDRHLICMYESKGRGGYICFCSAEKCNPGGVAETSPRAMALIFAATLMLLHGRPPTREGLLHRHGGGQEGSLIHPMTALQFMGRDEYSNRCHDDDKYN